MGNLGHDPELRYTPSGTAVCNMSVAVSLPTDQNNVETLWVCITIWGKQAETVNQYLKKGRKTLIFCDRIRFDAETGGPVMFTRSNGDKGASFELTAAWSSWIAAAMARTWSSRTARARTPSRPALARLRRSRSNSS